MSGVTRPIATVVGSLDQLERIVARYADAKPRVLIGITGAPGAGKSTVASALVSRLGPSAGLLPMDGFHLPQARLVALGRRERMGAPDTFDVDGFVDVLERVRADDDAVAAPGFDRRIEEPVPDVLTITRSKRVVVVEGNYLLADTGGWERVDPLLDAVVYLDPPSSLRLERLIARHVRYGKTPDEARAWALGPDEANARLIAATRWRADHIAQF
jgi:pantothenate kinase